MGIKERERRVEVFLYGLFMDEELLRGKGLEPEGGEITAIDGFALRTGQRAALVPTPGAKVYGLVFSLTRSELDRLYSESSVQAYKPQAVLAQLASGGVVAALCYKAGITLVVPKENEHRCNATSLTEDPPSLRRSSLP
jgi:hypothetical protein